MTTTASPATFAVRDPMLAAFLRTRGHVLVTVERDRQGRPSFGFEDSDRRASDILLFVEGASVALPPKTLLLTYRGLQSALATTPRPSVA